MTTTKVRHTPGPWRYQEKSDAYTHIVRGPDGQYIAGCGQDRTGECEGNARLIAAAPTMLESLKALVAETERCDNPALMGVGSEAEVMQKAKAAITSAEGESA